jgi:hypothetical protein
VISAIAFAIVAWRMTVRVRMPIPYLNSGNVFTDFGLGPPTLRDVFTLHLAASVRAAVEREGGA